jgi:y4mF family transcriptional regulator
MEKKYLYIAENKLMPGFCKIGISDNVENRMEALYGDWTIYKKIRTDNAGYYESIVKYKLRHLRAHGHELFNCPTEYLEKVVRDEIHKPEEVVLPNNAKIINCHCEELGKLIRSTRKSQKMTQAQFAGACGCGTRLIVDVEKGKKTCEVGKVLHLLTMLGLDLFISERKWNRYSDLG